MLSIAWIWDLVTLLATAVMTHSTCFIPSNCGSVSGLTIRSIYNTYFDVCVPVYLRFGCQENLWKNPYLYSDQPILLEASQNWRPLIGSCNFTPSSNVFWKRMATQWLLRKTWNSNWLDSSAQGSFLYSASQSKCSNYLENRSVSERRQSP